MVSYCMEENAYTRWIKRQSELAHVSALLEPRLKEAVKLMAKQDSECAYRGGTITEFVRLALIGRLAEQGMDVGEWLE